MRRIESLLLLVAFALPSCVTEQMAPDVYPAPDIVANVDESTKTILVYDTNTGMTHVNWCPADELNVFFGTRSVKYTSTNTEYAGSAVFKTEETLSEAEYGSTGIWGLYPYDVQAKCDGSHITTSLPSQQMGIAGSFDDNLAVMAASGSDTRLFFRNVCSGLKFTLTRDDIKSVTFQGNRNESLAGAFALGMQDGIPVVTTPGSDASVTLIPKEGDTFKSGEEYIIMTLPVEMEKGFTISFGMDNARGTFRYEDKKVSLPRNDFGVKRDLDSFASFYFDVVSVTLNTTVATMRMGSTLDLVATVNPANATDRLVTWTSSDESVASVSDGVVRAVSFGTAIITATAGNKSATCSVSVVANPVTSITLSEESLTLKAGQTATLVASVGPEDADDKTVIWSSSDESVASVVDGLVTAHKSGTAAITASAGLASAICNVTVEDVSVESISLNMENATMRIGEKLTLTATVKPDNATDKTVAWVSLDPSVVTVDNGELTAIQSGSATIIAFAGLCDASCEVTVLGTDVAGVTLNKTELTLTVGQTETLIAIVTPEDASDKGVIWRSSDKKVASVDDNGKVLARSPGSTVITVETKDGGFTAECQVTVKPVLVESVSLDHTEMTVRLGESKTLTATVSPYEANDKTCTWRSSDEEIVTVSDGVVTGAGLGTAVVTVITNDGGHTAECKVTVEPVRVESIRLDCETMYLGRGESRSMNVYFEPWNATNKNVIWRSSDESVATVENSTVTGVGAGTAVITAESEDGGFTAQCTVTVYISIQSVSFDVDRINIGETKVITPTFYPAEATYRSIRWESYNPEIASISEDGVITGISRGSAWITCIVETEYNTLWYGFTVFVIDPNIVEFINGEFRQYCLENFDADGDGEISLQEADAVKEIRFSNFNYTNMRDIKYFRNLETLVIGQDNLDTWHDLYGFRELSSLCKLKHLELYNLGLRSDGNFDISALSELEYLDLQQCRLQILDVSKNAKLSYLDCAPMRENIQKLIIHKGQIIPNVTVNRSADYIPEGTMIFIEGSSSGSGNEKTEEGEEI